MILSYPSKRDLPQLTIHDKPLERVSVFKLLCVHISDLNILNMLFLNLCKDYTS